MSKKGKALAAVMAGLMVASLAAPAYAATVRYDLNGPAGVVHEHTEDGDVEVEEIGVDFDGLGKLTGWNTRPDGTGEAYETGDKVAADATLYAQYSDGTFAPADGLNTAGGKTYYYEGSTVKTGLLRIGDAEGSVLMYFDAADGGAAATSRLIEDGGDKYYAGSDGVLVSDTLQECEGKTYYFGADGKARAGVVEVAGAYGAALMYFSADGPRVEDGWVEDEGKSYLARGGELVRSALADDSGKTYAFGDDGGQLSGHVEVEGKWYVADGEDTGEAHAGWVEKDCWVVASDDGSEGYADTDGALLTGLQEFSGVAHWFNEEGVAEGGWHETGLTGERAWCNSISQTGLVIGWSATRPTPGTDTSPDKGDTDGDADQDKSDADDSGSAGRGNSDNQEGIDEVDKTDGDGTPGNGGAASPSDEETSGTSDKPGEWGDEKDSSTNSTDVNAGGAPANGLAADKADNVSASPSVSTSSSAAGAADLPQTGVGPLSLALVASGAAAAAVAGGRLAWAKRRVAGDLEDEGEA